MIQFYENYKYRWNIADEYGWDIPKSEMRNVRIEEILNNIDYFNRFTYNITLFDVDDKMEIHMALYRPKQKKLSIYPFGEEGKLVRVNFLVENIQQCEEYLDIVCEGNNLKVAPVNTKNEK